MKEQVLALMPNLKAEILPPVIAKGMPKASDFQAIDDLAETISRKHKELGLK
jgi:hypothetical protein